MSYYRVFYPPKEIIDKLEQKAIRANSYNSDSTEIELRTYCMLDHSNDKIHDVIEHLRLLLSMLSYDAISMSYKYAVGRYREDEGNRIEFCGRQYSHACPETSIEESYKYVLPKLVSMCCVVKTPDWYEENEKFYDKQNEIDSLIVYFIDVSSENGNYEIIDMIKEWESKSESDMYADLLEDLKKQNNETKQFVDSTCAGKNENSILSQSLSAENPIEPYVGNDAGIA